MNYRHVYHAGNRCDVVKHTVLTLLLRHLREKDKGFMVLDTHAGTGFYDLKDQRAEKTKEAVDGIFTLIDASDLPEALSDYIQALRHANPLWKGRTPEGFRVYPGSPLITFHGLRAQDRLIAIERHPDDAHALKTHAPADKRFQAHNRDGYEALSAFLPPPEKRGLVFIDPPFEEPNEFETLANHITEAHRRWPTGMFMIWYPIKDRPAIWKFHDALVRAEIPKILAAEFIYDEEIRTDRLSGSGQIIINPPWKLDETLSTLFPILHEALKTTHQQSIVKWLTE